MVDSEYLKKAHKASGYNRYLVEISKECACYYCLRTFPPEKIDKWVDTREIDGKGQTAICPFCGIDSVLPDAACFSISPEFLAAMHEYWF